MRYVLNIICFVGLGLLLSTLGVTISDWQYWISMVILGSALIGNVIIDSF